MARCRLLIESATLLGRAQPASDTEDRRTLPDSIGFTIAVMEDQSCITCGRLDSQTYSTNVISAQCEALGQRCCAPEWPFRPDGSVCWGPFADLPTKHFRRRRKCYPVDQGPNRMRLLVG
jgi:hypothetical protein